MTFLKDPILEYIKMTKKGNQTSTYKRKKMNNRDEKKDHPHADGDYSYMCGRDYCRCMQ